jgi:membrane protein
MDPLSPVKKFDAFQQRHRSLAIPMAVVKKFGDDGAGNLAALFAYYAFFSLFPLLLVFITVLGYVLQHSQHALHSIENSVQSNFPALGKVVNFTTLHGHWYVLVIGLLTSLWSGLGVTGAAQNALDTIWAVPRKSRPDFIHSKLRGIGLLLAIGILFIASTGASALVTGGLGGPAAKVAGILVSLLVNVVLFLLSFRLMTATSIPTRHLLKGALLAAVFWTILQSLGGLYINHVMKNMSPAYETVGTVIALLIWLHLGAQMTLYAAELNTVLERDLYPRSLMGPPSSRADEAALTALAKTEERSDVQHVEVEFTDPDKPVVTQPQEPPERDAQEL